MRRRSRLTSITPLPAAITLAVLHGILGVIVAIFAGFTGQVNGVAVPMPLVIGMPVIYALVGFLSGGIGAALYNLVAGFTGGIEFDFTDSASEWDQRLKG